MKRVTKNLLLGVAAAGAVFGFTALQQRESCSTCAPVGGVAVDPVVQAFFAASKANVSHIEVAQAEPNAAAPEWSIESLDGEEISTESLRGKVTVVNFWATWCGPCVASIPAYAQLHRKYEDENFAFVGVSVDRRGADHVRAFLNGRDVPYTVAMTSRSVEKALGPVRATPTTVILDAEGKIRHRHVGAVSKTQMVAEIEALLKESETLAAH